MAVKKRSPFEKFLEYSLIFLISIVVLLVLIQVFSRYLFQLPFIGIEELARLIFVWACFLGTSLGVIQNRHISIDILLNRFPKNLKKFSSLVVMVIILVVSVVMVIYGAQFTISTWAYPDYSTALFYPRSLFYLPVPISGTIIFLYTAKQIITKYTKYGPDIKLNPDY